MATGRWPSVKVGGWSRGIGCIYLGFKPLYGNPVPILAVLQALIRYRGNRFENVCEISPVSSRQASVEPNGVCPAEREIHDNCSHVCKDRIVSLEQSFVQPTNRGKRPNPTEFGQNLHLSVVDGFTYLEQTGRSSSNEGCGLQSVVEKHYRKFGCYSEAVLADKIYPTQDNRRYCMERRIRLSGPVLGRPKTGDAGAKESRQMCISNRNAAESRSVNRKRRYGLDLVMSKLDETTKTKSALNILAINAAPRPHRWLLYFLGSGSLCSFFSSPYLMCHTSQRLPQ